ncbi:hypothetical protein ElyMa_006834100 [Elysia marginata]|uniref:Mutator-like transposase domain-containing protein n=1 Tax=Elysia marginata TaxID=1093978 RepID=A0AAV4J698_9GAST|nr:hypothetical protein ElyMa_006834100 [Elysia marginata]
MMEVEAAVELWGRSVARNKLRYTVVVSDGDSKAFNKLSQIQPYGPDVPIDKEDCLNHVGKRCGTALRNLVADCSKKGVTLGGRGRGRLTADAVRKLQIYYSRAIRQNKTAEDMKRAILASLFHGYSTDNMPQHQYCPPGPDSRCFFKRSIGNHLYPTGRIKWVYTPLDFDLLHKHLEPLYQRLTNLDLLWRCERKVTQNPSESFHHSVWSRCSKKNLHSLKRVHFAVISAAAEYNRGPAAASTVKNVLGFQVGEDASRLGHARMQKRVERSILQQQQKQNRRRAKRAEAKEKARKEKEAEEGGPAYQAGMF